MNQQLKDELLTDIRDIKDTSTEQGIKDKALALERKVADIEVDVEMS